MVESKILGDNKISGRAGSGVVIKREAQTIKNNVEQAIAERDWGKAQRYLASIKNKSEYRQVNALVENLLTVKGNVRWSKRDIRRGFERDIYGRIDNVSQYGRQKQKLAKSNISQAQQANQARGLSTATVRRSEGTLTQDGATYKIGPDGSFERVSLSTAEQERRARIKTGTATASDIFAGLNVKNERDQLKALNRINPALRKQDLQFQTDAINAGRDLLARPKPLGKELTFRDDIKPEDITLSAMSALGAKIDKPLAFTTGTERVSFMARGLYSGGFYDTAELDLIKRKGNKLERVGASAGLGLGVGTDVASLGGLFVLKKGGQALLKQGIKKGTQFFTKESLEAFGKNRVKAIKNLGAGLTFQGARAKTSSAPLKSFLGPQRVLLKGAQEGLEAGGRALVKIKPSEVFNFGGRVAKGLAQGTPSTVKAFTVGQQGINLGIGASFAVAGVSAKDQRTIKDISGETFSNQGDEIGGNIAKQTAFAVSPGIANKDQFERLFREEASKRGLSKQEINRLTAEALVYRRNLAFIEPVASVGVASTSDLIARKAVAKGFAKLGDIKLGFGRNVAQSTTRRGALGKGATLTGDKVFAYGSLEGASLTATSLEARREPRDSRYFTTLGFGTAIGGAGAGLLASSAVRKTFSKSQIFPIQTGNILDPFEIPGNIGANIFESGLKKGDIPTPAIIKRRSATRSKFKGKDIFEIGDFDQLNFKAGVKGKRVRTRVSTPTFTPTGTVTDSPTGTFTFTTTSTPTITSTFTPTSTSTVTGTPTITTTTTSTPTSTSTPTATTTPTITTTPTPTGTPTPTVTPTPILSFFPPILPSGKGKPAKVEAYNVLVKQGKDYKKINRNGLNKASAINLGARFVDTKPAKEFKIVKTKGKPFFTGDFINKRIDKFERKGNVFTEMTKFRRDSFDEKRAKKSRGIFDVSF